MSDLSNSPEASPAKRPLEDAADPAARKKRARTSTSSVKFDAKSVLAMDDAAIGELSQANAITCLINLKSAYAQLQEEHAAAIKKAASSRAAPAASSSTAAPVWTPAKVAEAAQKIRKNTAAAIKKQMKWQPSCKKGTTKWSISVLAPTVEVLKAVFGFPATDKEVKLKKLTMEEFERAFGCIEVSIRYGSLEITGTTVTLRWSAETSQFSLSGTYGVPA
ncbi:unnamed protein product [Tilletia controversa]|nr:unnamed protein product [Tilletia controversa]